MKFQKIDQKQVPQVAALSVLCVAVLGYGAYSFLSGRPSGSPAAAAAPSAELAQPAPTPTRVASTGSPAPAVSGQYNSDPFRPAIKVQQGQPAPRSQAQPTPDFRPEPRPLDWPGEAPPREFPGALDPDRPVAPPAPERPAVVVTGVIDAREGVDMALVQLGTDRRIVQVGDVLGNNYRVKRIGLDGVLLVNGKDRFFVGLGAKLGAGPNG